MFRISQFITNSKKKVLWPMITSFKQPPVFSRLLMRDKLIWLISSTSHYTSEKMQEKDLWKCHCFCFRYYRKEMEHGAYFWYCNLPMAANFKRSLLYPFWYLVWQSFLWGPLWAWKFHHKVTVRRILLQWIKIIPKIIKASLKVRPYLQCTTVKVSETCSDSHQSVRDPSFVLL